MVSGGRYFNPLFPLYLFPRGEDFENVRIYERYDEERRFPVQNWEYGDQGLSFENPYWIINREMFPTKKNRYMMHARLQYDILDWLRSEEHTSELQSRQYLVCRLLLEKTN